MSSPCAKSRAFTILLALFAVFVPGWLTACGEPQKPLLPRSQTWAELRTVRRAVSVTPPGEAERAPYPRERLVDGEKVSVGPEGLAWLRRDGGATLLIRGPAALTLRSDVVDLAEGRVFIDTPAGFTTELATPNGPLHLAHVRASIDVSSRHGTTVAYVLAGEVRTDGAARATAGEQLTLSGKPGATQAKSSAVLTWEDWTGGLATTDRAAEPSPFGVGTVGARRPGDQGAPRFPLAIQRLDVRTKIVNDFALTEVDEVFFNPSGAVVEGIYRFRTPEGATLHRFGVDREGVLVWGRVKEKQAAAAQYQSNVYQGSTEDPALLEWDAPGVYRARLYPIGPGESRRVVVRYAEWLGRTGRKGERRLYVYPMAAEGAEGSLPHIEELIATIDLSQAGAKEVRVGMSGVREGHTLVVREHDLVPRADLAVELFDEGAGTPRGYTAPHEVDVETVALSQRAEAQRLARNEADYVVVPIRAADVPLPPGGLDMAIVVDTSAATDPASLAIARAATAALLAHLGPSDRAIVWAGDVGLTPVVPGRAALAAIDEAGRRDVMTHLARIERGGATDLGAMLSQAALALDPARRGVMVYIGDGAPTVGELALADLRDRLAKLPRPVRIFSLGVGDGADMAMLKGLARAAFAERIGDANSAARAALRLLEQAERPAWLGTSVDLGPTVERIFPRDLGAIVADESLVVIGRRTAGGALPAAVTISGPAGSHKMQLQISPMADAGDLRRRWAEGRLAQMMDEAIGRAAMVDLGSRYGIITPVTSLYVPTKNEMTPAERDELNRSRAQARRESITEKRTSSWNPFRSKNDDDADEEDRATEQVAEPNADNKEGGTGTRAKGEEGSMGNPNSRSTGNRYGVAGPADNPVAAAPAAAATAAATPTTPMPSSAPRSEPQAEHAPGDGHAARQASLRDAAEFGMLGLLNAGAGGDPNAPTAPWGRDDSLGNDPLSARGNTWGDSAGDSFGSGGLGLSGVGEGGAGRGEGLGSIGTVGGGAGTGNGQGFGSGHGRLGGSHRAAPPQVKAGVMVVDLPKTAEETKKPSEKDADAGGKDKLAKTGAEKSAVETKTEIVLRLGDVPRVALLCGGAAQIPFEERIGLWRERLGRVAGNADAVISVYRSALRNCEAPAWRERSKLLSMLLDAMPNVVGRVSLWRKMFTDLGAADALYRGMLARVKTPQEMRDLHAALGLKSIDPGILAKVIKDAKTPAERAAKLRDLVAVWPDDFTLALRLMDALEDAGDFSGARVLGRKLRSRPDADARVRTAVGELSLRLSKRAPEGSERTWHEAEARQAFGEIVEFAPDDPVARRRLGDLLRTHGWYAEAARQYETLARLAPDDAAVALLLSAAAQGQNKLEEAIKWTEKGGAAGAPDIAQSPAGTARAFAATYLAWGRLDAREKGRKDEEQMLTTRLVRVLSAERGSDKARAAARVALTWSHPEFHPTLWSNALGAPMPAPEGDITLGIAQVMMPGRGDAFVEVRLEPDEVEHAARLGATAVLTVVFNEAEEGEKIIKLDVAFKPGGPAVQRFSIAGGAVQEVSP